MTQHEPEALRRLRQHVSGAAYCLAQLPARDLSGGAASVQPREAGHAFDVVDLGGELSDTDPQADAVTVRAWAVDSACRLFEGVTIPDGAGFDDGTDRMDVRVNQRVRVALQTAQRFAAWVEEARS